MENAVDALTMAGSVLLLIIALSVSISSFTSLKSQVDEILSIEEETDLATYTDANRKCLIFKLCTKCFNDKDSYC